MTKIKTRKGPILFAFIFKMLGCFACLRIIVWNPDSSATFTKYLLKSSLICLSLFVTFSLSFIMILFLRQADLSLRNGFIVHQNCWFLLPPARRSLQYVILVIRHITEMNVLPKFAIHIWYRWLFNYLGFYRCIFVHSVTQHF